MSYRALYWAARYAECPTSMRCVLSELAAFANDDGVAWPSVPTMAADLGMSERNVQLLLRRLEGAGLIEFIGTSDVFADVRADKVTSVWRLAVPDDILHGNLKKAIASRRLARMALRSLGSKPGRGEKTRTSGVKNPAERGEESFTPPERGEILSMSGVKFSAERGEILSTSGVKDFSPKRFNKDSYKDSGKDNPLKPPTGGGRKTEEETMYRLTGGERTITLDDGTSWTIRQGKCTRQQAIDHLDGTTSASTCPICHASVANQLTHAAHAAHKETR